MHKQRSVIPSCLVYLENTFFRVTEVNFSFPSHSHLARGKFICQKIFTVDGIGGGKAATSYGDHMLLVGIIEWGTTAIMIGPFALYSRGLDRSPFIDGGYKKFSKWCYMNKQCPNLYILWKLQERKLQVSLVARNFLRDLQLGLTVTSVNVLPCIL